MFSVALLLLLAAGSCVKCQQLTQPASVTVQPGQRISITCQVSYSVSTYATHWIRQPAGEGLEWIGYKSTGGSNYKDSLKNQFSIELDPSNKRVTLIGQNMQPGDSAVYYCARDYNYWAFDYWGKGTTVTVTSDTTTVRPTVFPMLPCGGETGNTVTLGCMATGFTPSSLMFSWTKGTEALADFVQYPPTLKDNRYTKVTQVKVPRQDWDSKATFYCKAELGGHNSNTPFRKPDPLYQMPNLKVMVSNDENGASFACFANDFSPKKHQFKWLRDEEKVPENMYTKTPVGERSGVNGTLYSAASFLTIDSEVMPGTEFKCEFQGISASGNYHINSSLIYQPECNPEPCPKPAVEIQIIDPTNEDMFLKGKGSVTCKVTVNSPTLDRITWEDQDGNEMAGASKIPTDGEKGPFLVPLDITMEEWNGTLKRYCVVEHSGLIDPQKEAYERFEEPHQRQRPTVFMLPPIEHTRKNEVTLTCYVKDFFPHEILVTWLVDDMPANSSYAFKTTNPLKNGRNYSVYGQLSLTTEQWKRKDIVYSCVVHHLSLIDSNKSIVRSVVYTDSDKTNLVNLSLNVPNTCRAQ